MIEAMQEKFEDLVHSISDEDKPKKRCLPCIDGNEDKPPRAKRSRKTETRKELADQKKTLSEKLTQIQEQFNTQGDELKNLHKELHRTTSECEFYQKRIVELEAINKQWREISVTKIKQ